MKIRGRRHKGRNRTLPLMGPNTPGQMPETGRFARPPPAKWLVFPCFPRKYGYIPRHLTRKHGLKGRPVAAGPKGSFAHTFPEEPTGELISWRYLIFLCVSCLKLACTLVTNRT